MDRRTLLKGFAATAAGLLLPAGIAAEPARRVWALDRTMLAPGPSPRWPLGDLLHTLLDDIEHEVRRQAYVHGEPAPVVARVNPEVFRIVAATDRGRALVERRAVVVATFRDDTYWQTGPVFSEAFWRTRRAGGVENMLTSFERQVAEAAFPAGLIHPHYEFGGPDVLVG